MSEDVWTSREEPLPDGRVRLWYTFADGASMPVVVNRDAWHPETVRRIGTALAAEKHRLLPNVQRVDTGD